MTETTQAEELPIPDGYDPEAVAAAVGMVRAWCEWHIAPVVSQNMWLDGPGGRLLLLPTMHLLQRPVVQQSMRSSNHVDRLEPVEDFDWSTKGLLWRDRGWTGRLGGIRATITHGYDAWPAEVRAVILRIARAGLAPRTNIASASSDGTQITYRSDVPAGVIDQYAGMILDKYSLPQRV